MNQPEYRFFYVRAEPSLAEKTAFALTTHKPHKLEPKGFPVACVAFHLRDGVEHQVVDFAFATHNPTDTYSRDAAKAWALLYLTTKNKYRGSVAAHEKGLIIKLRIMEILSLPGAPLRVQKAARYWLDKHTKPSRFQPHKPFKVDVESRLETLKEAFQDSLPPAAMADTKKRPHLISRKRKK